jgi:integrase
MVTAAPVEYAVAAERYLAAAGLSAGSRRVYGIALATWAWLLAGRPAPAGRERRRAQPPVLPLALLDGPQAADRVRAAYARRGGDADPRTVNRELSALRGAVAWWHGQGWLDGDPTAGLRPLPTGPAGTPADADALRTLFALRVPLREKTLWRLLHESGGTVEAVLALNVDDLDLPARQTRGRPGRPALRWGQGAARLLPLLVAGRTEGPLFRTDRRARHGTPRADRCPYTGRARLSYRRAAELFADATRPLDPAGRGWTLRRLRPSATRRRGDADSRPKCFAGRRGTHPRARSDHGRGRGAAAPSADAQEGSAAHRGGGAGEGPEGTGTSPHQGQPPGEPERAGEHDARR